MQFVLLMHKNRISKELGNAANWLRISNGHGKHPAAAATAAAAAAGIYPVTSRERDV